MPNQDEIDTEPIYPRSGPGVAHQSLVMAVGERIEVEVVPQAPMQTPMLIISAKPWSFEIVVEQIACGNLVIDDHSHPANSYKFGRHIAELVTSESPLRIVLVNGSPKSVKIGISLLAPAGSPGAYSQVKDKG